MKPAQILLLNLRSEDGLIDALRNILEKSFESDFKVLIKTINCASETAALDEAAKTILQLAPSIVFLGMQPEHLPQAAKLFDSLRKAAPNVPVIVVVDEGDPNAMLELLRHGASDFVTPPLKGINIVPRVWRLLEQVRKQVTAAFALKQTLGLKRLVGESPAFVAEVNKLPVIARCDATVLILGETGTGKELCARSIHYLSPRASKPFVPVNCSAIPVELVENELFGHEREAFTGASSSRPGLITEADG